MTKLFFLSKRIDKFAVSTKEPYKMEKRISNAKRYVEDVADTIARYIDNKDNYPHNACLIVLPALCETVIDDPQYTKDCDIYDLRHFIRKKTNGEELPDRVSIERLARRYYA